jgi:hypothetical protein
MGVRTANKLRRPAGTGAVRRRHCAELSYEIVAPRHRGEKDRVIAAGFLTYVAAEKYLDAWLKEKRPDAYATLLIERDRLERNEE